MKATKPQGSSVSAAGF